MVENGAYLFQRDAGEPFDELRRCGTVFKVFKQRGNRNTRSHEYPSSAYTLWIPLNCGTS